MSAPQSPAVTCEQILQGLNEYVDGETLSAVCREFAAHLAGCNPCQIVVDNIRNTIRLYKDGEPYPVPPEVTDRLRDALRRKWAERFPATGD